MAREPQPPKFFASPAALHRWLARNAHRRAELWVGFHKLATRRRSVTWPESVDAALCYGWIDGIRKRIDEHSYTIRFSPRKPRSIWSSVNVARAEALIAQGLMQPAGLAAYAARSANRSGIYSYELRPQSLPEPYAIRLAARPAARAYFDAQPASYRRTAIWWVVSAKQEVTRERRLSRLIEDCAAGRRISQFVSPRPAPARSARKPAPRR